MIELSSKDLLQLATFVILAVGALWRFNNILGDIKTKLELITQRLNDLHPMMSDHEQRIRALEKKCVERGGDV